MEVETQNPFRRQSTAGQGQVYTQRQVGQTKSDQMLCSLLSLVCLYYVFTLFLLCLYYVFTVFIWLLFCLYCLY